MTWELIVYLVGIPVYQTAFGYFAVTPYGKPSDYQLIVAMTCSLIWPIVVLSGMFVFLGARLAEKTAK